MAVAEEEVSSKALLVGGCQAHLLSRAHKKGLGSSMPGAPALS